MQFANDTGMIERQAMRRRFLGLRQVLTRESPQKAVCLAAAIRQWLEGQNGRCVGIYSPFRGEPDVRPGLAAMGIALAYPVVDDKASGRMHYRRVTKSTVFVSGAYGIEEPQGGEVVVPDILFSPCIAVTPEGFRLGNGGGFFDRYMARMTAENRRPMTVAVAYDALVTNDFCPQAHDVAFDWIATESGVWRSASL